MSRNPIAPTTSAGERDDGLFDPAELYHEASKTRRWMMPLADAGEDDRLRAVASEQGALWVAAVYEQVKRTTRRTRNARKVALPLDAPLPAKSLADVILERRSERRFAPEPLALGELGNLLRLSYGISRGHQDGDPAFLRRACAAAGGLYELELYVAVDRVEGLAPGLYHYEVASHELALLSAGDAVPAIERVSVRPVVEGAAAVIVLAAVMERLTWKYGVRSYRLALLNAGHAGQQLCAASTAHGLASCPVQGFVDDELADLLGTDGLSEIPLHAVFVGRPAAVPAVPSAPGGRPARAPRLRTAHGLPPSAGAEPWVPLDGLMREAFAALADGRTTDARERLVALGALLPGDETVRDYVRLAEGDDATLAAGRAGHCVFPRDWPEDRRRQAIALVEEAGAVVARWLDVDVFPATLVDFRAGDGPPRTHLRGRRVERKVTLPPSARRDEVVHELTHALLAPANLLIAEGLASLVASDAHEVAEIEAELAREEHPPIRVESFFGGASADASSFLVHPVGASFVRHLVARFGRERFFAFTETLLATQTDVDQAALFADAFGTSPAGAVADWWSVVRSSRTEGPGGSASQQAVERLRRATELEPTRPELHAQLAEAALGRALAAGRLVAMQMLVLCHRAAKRALELDPDCRLAHLVMGLVALSVPKQWGGSREAAEWYLGKAYGATPAPMQAEAAR